MNEEKQQKFTAKVRRGLVWIHSVAGAELAKKKAEATGVHFATCAAPLRMPGARDLRLLDGGADSDREWDTLVPWVRSVR